MGFTRTFKGAFSTYFSNPASTLVTGDFIFDDSAGLAVIVPGPGASRTAVQVMLARTDLLALWTVGGAGLGVLSLTVNDPASSLPVAGELLEVSLKSAGLISATVSVGSGRLSIQDAASGDSILLRGFSDAAGILTIDVVGAPTVFVDWSVNAVRDPSSLFDGSSVLG